MRVPDSLTSAEVNALLEAGGPKHRLWILLGADAGLRNAEIRSLTPDHVLPSGLLHIKGKGGRVRKVPLTARLSQALALEDLSRAAYRVPMSRPYVPICARALQRRFRNIARAAGVYVPGRVPHTLRHSYATRLVDAGVPLHVVQKLLGHASLQTTEIYLHSSAHSLMLAAHTLQSYDFQEAGCSPFPENAAYRPASAIPGRTPWRRVQTKLRNFLSKSRRQRPRGSSSRT